MPTPSQLSEKDHFCCGSLASQLDICEILKYLLFKEYVFINILKQTCAILNKT